MLHVHAVLFLFKHPQIVWILRIILKNMLKNYIASFCNITMLASSDTVNFIHFQF